MLAPVSGEPSTRRATWLRNLANVLVAMLVKGDVGEGVVILAELKLIEIYRHIDGYFV